jgi:hypothetical protein
MVGTTNEIWTAMPDEDRREYNKLMLQGTNRDFLKSQLLVNFASLTASPEEAREMNRKRYRPVTATEPEPPSNGDHTRRLLTISFAIDNMDDGMALTPFIAQALRTHADEIEGNQRITESQFGASAGKDIPGCSFSGAYRFECGTPSNEYMVTVRWRAGYGTNTTKPT